MPHVPAVRIWPMSDKIPGFRRKSIARVQADCFRRDLPKAGGAFSYSFNTQGLPFQQTSYSDSAAISVVNQDQDTYNGFGQLTKVNGDPNPSNEIRDWLMKHGWTPPQG